MTDKTILITGATGQQGGAIADELLEHGCRVRAMTRKPDGEPARKLHEKGAEVIYGDLDEPGSLTKALEGAWGALGVQNTWEAGVEKEEEQGKRFARAAREAGVQHYVYQSVGSADRDTGIPHFDNKWRVEQVVRELDFPSWAIVRPVFFMENLASPWFKPAIDEGTLALGISPDTTLQMIAVDDIGKYGAMAFLEHERMNGMALDIAGDELTAEETARILGEAAGREIAHYQVPLEEVREFSEDFAAMLAWFEEVGYHADIAGNAERYGIRPTPFAEWARRRDWTPAES